MTMLQKLIYAGAASAAMFAVAPASAAAVVNNQYSSFDGTTGIYGAIVNGAGAFSAPFTFNVGALPGKAAFSISSVSLKSAAAIQGLTITLNNVAYPITSTMALPDGTVYKFGGFSQSIPAFVQQFSISGTTTTSSSPFSGTFGFTAAVPEPASWALMIGGFGLIGGVMRRRGKTATRVTFAHA